jgi:hypothetical protein
LGLISLYFANKRYNKKILEKNKEIEAHETDLKNKNMALSALNKELSQKNAELQIFQRRQQMPDSNL